MDPDPDSDTDPDPELPEKSGPYPEIIFSDPEHTAFQAFSDASVGRTH